MSGNVCRFCKIHRQSVLSGFSRSGIPFVLFWMLCERKVGEAPAELILAQHFLIREFWNGRWNVNNQVTGQVVFHRAGCFCLIEGIALQRHPEPWQH
jgi:hypothetical protein